jgi:hypothetical protein
MKAVLHGTPARCIDLIDSFRGTAGRLRFTGTNSIQDACCFVRHSANAITWRQVLCTRTCEEPAVTHQPVFELEHTSRRELVKPGLPAAGQAC